MKINTVKYERRVISRHLISSLLIILLASYTLHMFLLLTHTHNVYLYTFPYKEGKLLSQLYKRPVEWLK